MMSRRLKRLTAATAAMTVAGVAALAALDHVFPPDLSKIRDKSALVVDRHGELLQAFTAADGRWRLPAALDDVDGRYLRMLLAFEDKRFERHPGIDPLAIGRAIGQWVRHGRVVSGASTITMQAARLLEPRPRTLPAKLIEMARALQLEWRFTKAEILEVYLTLAPFGGNIEGVRAASLFYFGKEPGRLTDAEAALLVALPQSPESLRPDRHSESARKARNGVIARMTAIGLLTPKAAAEAAREEVPAGRYPAMRSAVHLAYRLKSARSDMPRIESFIEATTQRQIEALARRHHAALEETATLAVLVVENNGRKVRAYLGSGDYFDDRRHGRNDMVSAVRSPGSALKPFIFGMAFDELMIHPETIVTDRPMRFGDYAPENFDWHYRGELTAREALQLSLNLPAVALLNRVGPARFSHALSAVGAPLRLPPEVADPGLPIALGGAGTTLEDLVMLYSALADGGRAQPLRLSPLDDDVAPIPLMGETAAWYLARILEESPPPPHAVAIQHRQQSDPIAFKTGTSYGFRDAWAIGFDEQYTVGVWVGRPDGSFSPGRMGRDAAAPLLFEVFDMLPRQAEDLALRRGRAAPAGAIVVSNAELPPALRRFDGGSSLRNAILDGRTRPRIEFPAEDATVDARQNDGEFATIMMRASGGQLPLRWLVNGELLQSLPYKRQAVWMPDSRGAARITVMDSAGKTASVEIWVE
jgi:penicillin-binding protein 1C